MGHPVLIILAALSILILLAVMWFVIDGLRHQVQGFIRKRQLKTDRSSFWLEVVERQDTAADLFALRLRRSDGKPLPAAKPGQYITLLIPDEPGKTIRRCYSLAAWEQNPHFYELGIKREKMGKVSSWLYQSPLPSKQISALLPRGGFALESPFLGEMVFVAGGIGITPLRAMLHRVQAEKNLPGNVSVTLYYAAREQERLMYHAEFQKLQETCAWFHYYPILSMPDANWHGLIGHLSADDILANLKLPKATNFYICAPAAMRQALTASLKENGITDSQLHYESFGVRSAGMRADNATQNTYPVTLLPSYTFMFQGQSTLLTALHDEGIHLIPSDCRAGSCGQCKVRLVEGKVRWLIKPECKIKTDEILLCCCVPERELTLHH